MRVMTAGVPDMDQAVVLKAFKTLQGADDPAGHISRPMLISLLKGSKVISEAGAVDFMMNQVRKRACSSLVPGMMPRSWF